LVPTLVAAGGSGDSPAKPRIHLSRRIPLHILIDVLIYILGEPDVRVPHNLAKITRSEKWPPFQIGFYAGAPQISQRPDGKSAFHCGDQKSSGETSASWLRPPPATPGAAGTTAAEDEPYQCYCRCGVLSDRRRPLPPHTTDDWHGLRRGPPSPRAW
jgi:hypothetical protein